MASKKIDRVELEIKDIDVVKVPLRIVGDTPLIVHKWSEKAKQMILDTQTKKTKTKARETKNPVEDFIDSMYWLAGEPQGRDERAFEDAVKAGARWGFPVTAIKKAATSGAYRNELTKDKVSLNGAFFIDGEGPEMLAEIKGVTPVMREDMVRVGNGAADIRFRGMFGEGWYMDLTLMYNRNGKYTLEQIINLINVGGFSCGIGEWRPEKGGMNGKFHVSAA